MLAVIRMDIPVWVEQGRPSRILWRGERFRVINEPTREARGLWTAWRTIVRSDVDHRTVVVDIEGDNWALVAVTSEAEQGFSGPLERTSSAATMSGRCGVHRSR